MNAQLKSLDVTVDAYLLDARHHGQSPHPDASNTSGQLLIDCVYDLDYFITKQATLHPSSPPPLLIGHSMGGKVCLLYSLFRPSAISGVVSLDAAPSSYTHTHTKVQYLIHQLYHEVSCCYSLHPLVYPFLHSCVS